MQIARLLVFVDYYIPAFRSGGPVRSVANMVERLGNEFEFWIFARDRDADETTPHQKVMINQWNNVGEAKVYYAAPGCLSMRHLKRIVKEVRPDVIYLNSFFSQLTISTLSLRWLGGLGKIPVVLAPRGELSPGALQLKRSKKSLYLKVASLLGLYKGVVLQASSQREQSEIRQCWQRSALVEVAPNIPALARTSAPESQKPPKRSGSAKFVFLSRISPKKNLLKAIEMLGEIQGDLDFDIYGPVRSGQYWDECKRAMERCRTLNVKYVSAIQPEEVASVLGKYHFLVLPTLSENFGHAILESMLARCPVIISDQTPWENLSRVGAGWDIPLENRAEWRLVLQNCVQMDQQEYGVLSARTRDFALSWISGPEPIESNVRLFRRALGVNGGFKNAT